MKKLLLALLLVLSPQYTDNSLYQMGIWERPGRGGQPLVLPRADQDLPDSWYLQAALDRLNRHCHPDGPVAVFRDGLPDLHDAYAYTQRAGAGWQIHLSDQLHGMDLFDVLVHEWAHTLAWGTGEDRPTDFGGHGWEWGVQYSRAYRCAVYDADVPDPTTEINLPSLQPLEQLHK